MADTTTETTETQAEATTDTPSVAMTDAFLAVCRALDTLTQEDKSRVLNAAGVLHGLIPIRTPKR